MSGGAEFTANVPAGPVNPFPMPSNEVRSAGAAAATAAPTPGWAAVAELESSLPGTLRCGFSFLSFLSFLSLSSLAIAVSATETSLWTIGMIVGALAGSAARTVDAGAARTRSAIVGTSTQAAAKLRLNTNLPHRSVPIARGSSH